MAINVGNFGKLMKAIGTTYCEEEHYHTSQNISMEDSKDKETEKKDTTKNNAPPLQLFNQYINCITLPPQSHFYDHHSNPIYLPQPQ
eukprot:8435782-Ditylum_brightwellii.AAC.1